MKNLLLLVFMCCAFALTAQTPFTMMASQTSLASKRSVSSLKNPWLGGKLAYNLKGNVEQSFLLSARVMHTMIAGERYAVPIVGNVGLDNSDSTSVDDGVSIGLFPYYNLGSDGKLQLLLHSGLNYRFVDKSDASKNEFRMLFGVEAALYGDDGGSPTTLSIAPEFIWQTGDVDNTSTGLAITGVLPIANGLGMLFEGNVPFNKFSETGLKIGVIVNGQIK